MRKSSRILSILLVACMLISAMVVAVSAAISTTPTTPAGATGSITPKTYTMGPTGNASNTSNNCITDASNGIANGSHVHASVTCTNGGTLFSAEDFIKPGGYKYATVDFDIMSDGYLKTEGDVISVDKEATSGKLAYRENIHISALLGAYTHFAYFVSNGDNWYLSADGTYSEDDVALATEKNAWNHVTMVDDGANVYLYLDGEFVSKTATKLSGKSYCRIGLDVSGIAKEDAIKTGYSIKVNNVVANKYSADYVSGAAFGLDDYITAADFTAPLYSCADVVYNSNYIYDNAVAGQDAVTVTYADKSVENYQNVPAFYAAASKMSESKLEGASIVSRRSLLSLNLPGCASSISVTVTGNSKITISKASLYTIDSENKTVEGTVYTLKGVNLQDLLNASKLEGLTEGTESLVTNKYAYEFDKSTGKLTTWQDLNLYASYDVVGDSKKYQQVLPLTKFEASSKSGPRLIAYSAASQDLSGMDYTIVDFDFSTQSYYFNSYTSSISISLYPATGFKGLAYIIRNGNDFYFSTNTTYEAENDILIETAGVWNHVTLIIKNGDTPTAAPTYVYFNGNYVGEAGNKMNMASGWQYFAFTFEGLAPDERGLAYFDFCIDNFAVNLYADGYDTANAEVANTLTTYFATTDYTTKSLTTLNDVIYSEKYENGKNTAPSVWDNIVVDLEVNGETTKYASLADAEVAIKAMKASDINGAKIYTSVDVNVDNLLPDGVKYFSIICNGAKATGVNYKLQNYMNTDDGTHVFLNKVMDSVSNGDITVLKNYDYDTFEWNPPAQNQSDKFLQDFSNTDGFNKYWTVKNLDAPTATLSGTGCPYTNWTRYNLADVKFTVYDIDVSDVYFNEHVTSIRFGGFDSSKFYFWPAVIISDENRENFYLSTDEKLSADDLLLSSVNGVWNHITFVVTSNKFYTFLDGELVGTIENSNYRNVDRFSFGMNVDSNKYTEAKVQFSMDNLVISKYGANYTSENYYGLDDYIGEIETTNKALYDCADVVYTRDYIYNTPVADQFVATVENNGTLNKYFNIKNALENLADGVTIESRKNIPAIDPDDAIQSYTIITKLGATMAKPSDKYYKISKTVDGATTTYVLSRVGEDELVIVNWEIFGNDELLFNEETSDVKGSEFSISDEFLAKLAELLEYVKGDYKWMIDMGEGFVFADAPLVPEDYANESVTVRIAAITVTWRDGAGEVYATESWFAGNEITPYDITGLSNVEITGNGWYNIDYTTWETAGMDMLNNKFVAEALTPMTFTAKKTPIPAFTEAKLNMSLLTKFEANLYITNRPLANITLGGIFSDAELTDNIIDTLKLAEVDGKSFYLDNFFFDNSDVDRVVSRYVNYTVVYNGQEYALVDEIQVSLLDYAEKVLAQYACGSEEANLAYNLINYANAAYALKTGVDYEEAVAFLALDGHEEGCACFATHDKADEEVCVGENSLGENVVGWSFDVSNEQPAFVVYVKVDEFDNALVEDIELAFFGINGTDVTDVAVKLVRGENVEAGDEVYATFFFEDMPLYNATEIFTLTVTDATTGEVYVANYSLATYIDFAIHEELDADALKVAEALYSFAKVAKDYKLN